MKRALLVPILILLSTGCNGLSTHQKVEHPVKSAVFAPTPQCTSLQSKYDLWGAVAVGATSLGGASGLGALTGEAAGWSTGLKEALSVTGIALSAIDGVAIFLRDQYASEYGTECEVATTSSVTSPKAALEMPKVPVAPFLKKCKMALKVSADGSSKGIVEDCEASAALVHENPPDFSRR